MELSKVIETRRSRRKYLDKEVSDENIRKIIDSTRYAPSSRNSQPWEFVIIRDKEIKRKLAELKGKENEECILGAKVIIAVCVDNKKSETRWVEDGACAAMNILLTAHDMGLGAVYVTGYTNSKPEVTEGIKKILGLPENIMPVVLIPVGYADPSEELEKKELKNIDEIIHCEKW
jgi:nitroreductase